MVNITLYHELPRNLSIVEICCVASINLRPLLSILAMAHFHLYSSNSIHVYTNLVLLWGGGGYPAQAVSENLELGPRDYILILERKRSKS